MCTNDVFGACVWTNANQQQDFQLRFFVFIFFVLFYFLYLLLLPLALPLHLPSPYIQIRSNACMLIFFKYIYFQQYLFFAAAAAHNRVWHYKGCTQMINKKKNECKTSHTVAASSNSFTNMLQHGKRNKAQLRDQSIHFIQNEKTVFVQVFVCIE